MRQIIAAAVVVSVLALVLAGCSSKSEPRKPAPTNAAAPVDSQGDSDMPSDQASAPVAAVGEVKIGMTYDEVVAKLGEPTTKLSIDDAGSGDMVCVWSKGNAGVSVSFRDGKAMTVQHSGSGEGSAVDTRKVTDNFSKVTMGMSEAEVDKLLGPPSQAGGMGAEGMSVTTKVWEVDGTEHVVTFMNGKVQMTTKD